MLLISIRKLGKSENGHIEMRTKNNLILTNPMNKNPIKLKQIKKFKIN